jgi:hypothetical protein
MLIRHTVDTIRFPIHREDAQIEGGIRSVPKETHRPRLPQGMETVGWIRSCGDDGDEAVYEYAHAV